MWVGFWTAAFPDSDYVLSFVDPLTYLTLHRGVTHSVLLLPLWAIGLAFLFSVIVRRRYSWKAFVGTCALGIGIHIAGDVITAFGTIVFAPFSAWRAQMPTTFIIDLYFSGIIIAGLVASAIWKHLRAPAIASLAVLVAYIGFGAVLHDRAVAVGDAYIATNRLDSARAEAIPQPFSPFNWMVVVEQPREYHLTYVSLWRDEVPAPPPPDAFWLLHLNASYRPVTGARWQTVSRFGTTDATLAEVAWNSNALRRYRGFAMFPAVYRVDRSAAGACVWFTDLRFNLVARPGPFRYGVCQHGDDSAWRTHRLISDSNSLEFLEAIPD